MKESYSEVLPPVNNRASVRFFPQLPRAAKTPHIQTISYMSRPDLIPFPLKNALLL